MEKFKSIFTYSFFFLACLSVFVAMFIYFQSRQCAKYGELTNKETEYIAGRDYGCFIKDGDRWFNLGKHYRWFNLKKH